MKKKSIEQPVEAKESQQVFSYKEELKEIKELLQQILECISLLKVNGGY